MGGAQLIARPIRMLGLIVLARLLTPRDFGLVALAMILIGTSDLFSGLGMGRALIHTKRDTKQVAFHALIVTFLFSSVLFLIVFALAPFFAQLLGDPEVTPIIRALSPVLVLDSIFLVPNALLRKEMMFGRVGAAKIASGLMQKGVAIVFALLGYGVWSLVYGELARTVTQLLVLSFAYPERYWLRPRRWAWEPIKELLRFGIPSTGSGFLSYLNSNWDDWLVGRVLGSTALGFYSRAYDLSNKGIASINQTVLNSVLFPSFARIQDNKERLGRMYLKGLGVIALALTPLSLGLFVVAPEAIPIVLGSKWAPMIPTLQVFAFMALVRPLTASTSPLFQAVGRPELNLRLGLVVLGVMFFIAILIVNKILPGTGPRMVQAILPALGAGIVMVLSVQLSKGPLLGFTGGEPNLITLGAMIAVGAVTYTVAAFLIQRRLILETISLFLSVFRGQGRMAFDGH
jgi:O-antigen/teichoic acid export membrane protein